VTEPTPPDELTAEMMCPHGERCCQGEPCNGPQTTCWHCKSEVPAVDSCPVCDGDGSVLDLEYVHGLARLAAERGERIRELEKELDELRESASMACETPPDGCDCAGCRYADEKMRKP
jgi:hypothetical protein